LRRSLHPPFAFVPPSGKLIFSCDGAFVVQLPSNTRFSLLVGRFVHPGAHDFCSAHFPPPLCAELFQASHSFSPFLKKVLPPSTESGTNTLTFHDLTHASGRLLAASTRGALLVRRFHATQFFRTSFGLPFLRPEIDLHHRPRPSRKYALFLSSSPLTRLQPSLPNRDLENF